MKEVNEITMINALFESFSFLKDGPNLYSRADLDRRILDFEIVLKK